MTEIKGYKVFNPDWTCRGFKYKIGETYKHIGDIGVCKAGFHFCKNIVDCFSYYNYDKSNKVAEVVAKGRVITKRDKSVTNILEIKKELTWKEVLELANTGVENTGIKNTGNRNTGNWNTGVGNAGNRNTGNWNTGVGNAGNWNTGCFNICNYATGFFNSTSPNIYMFNKPTNLTMIEFFKKYKKAVNLFSCLREYGTIWVDSSKMSEMEKATYPEYKITGGYLKVREYKECFVEWWENLKEKEKQEIRKLPNFDSEVFKEITGIDITGGGK